jgi:hypothetical protein
LISAIEYKTGILLAFTFTEMQHVFETSSVARGEFENSRSSMKPRAKFDTTTTSSCSGYE